MGPIDELTQEVAELRVRVEAAEAVQAIHNLKARYAQMVDERYVRGKVAPEEKVAAVAEQIAALFTADGVWDGGPALGVSTGREQIATRMRTPTLLFSWHFFLKPQIHVEGDCARARWDILSPCTTRDSKPNWMVGFEDDEYRRVEGAWLHAHMKLTTVFLAPHETGWQKIYY
jgi:nucleoid-associated protein YgaU